MDEPLIPAFDLLAITGEELVNVCRRIGIRVTDCIANHESAELDISFLSIHDAETFVSLGVDEDRTPGSMYDRATSGCVSLSAIGEDATDSEIKDVLEAGWTWMIHPDIQGFRISWHTHLTIPGSDAVQVTANLNDTLAAEGRAL